MRWYGVELERDEGCALCGSEVRLDLGEDFANEYGEQATVINTDTSFNIDDLSS